MIKKEVEGIILRICCFKLENIRSKYKFDYEKILNWDIIDVFADINLEKEYILDKNRLIIKCEDTYLHLTTKLILSMKILNNIYDIKQGILRCGDDLIFNQSNLINFLKINNKNDYIGKNFNKKDIINPLININFKNSITDTFMINYYNRHESDKLYINKCLDKYKKNINNINILPAIRDYIALGHIYYLSNKSINIIINNFKELDDNLNFSIIYDQENKYYPYVYEDIAIGYILFKNNINFTNYPEMWYNSYYQNFDTEPLKYVCSHTNEGNIF